jgi:hypothetical protein
MSIGLPVAYAAQVTIIISWPEGAYRGVGTLSNQAGTTAAGVYDAAPWPSLIMPPCLAYELGRHGR